MCDELDCAGTLKNIPRKEVGALRVQLSPDELVHGLGGTVHCPLCLRLEMQKTRVTCFAEEDKLNTRGSADLVWSSVGTLSRTRQADVVGIRSLFQWQSGEVPSIGRPSCWTYIL